VSEFLMGALVGVFLGIWLGARVSHLFLSSKSSQKPHFGGLGGGNSAAEDSKPGGSEGGLSPHHPGF